MLCVDEIGIGSFRETGVLFPIDILSSGEIARALDALRRIELAPVELRASLLGHKSHLISRTLSDLVRHPGILRAVERLLGPDVLVWGSDFFIKEPASPSYVSWHQDATYWGLTPDDVVSAWIALTPSTVESGCLRVIPGTHREPILPHTNTFAPDNMLSRGQTIEEVAEAKAVDVVLSPGQMSLHHVKIAHGSGPNRSSHRRVGFAVRYIGAHVRQARDIVDSATLVLGSNAHGNFALEPSPRGELVVADIAYHQSSWAVEQQAIAASAGT